MRVLRFVVRTLPLAILVQATFAVADASAESLIDRAARRAKEVADRRLPQARQVVQDLKDEAEVARERVRTEVAPQVRETAATARREGEDTAQRTRNAVRDAATAARDDARGTATRSRDELQDAAKKLEEIASASADRLIDKERKVLCNLFAPGAKEAVSKLIPDGTHVDIPVSELNLSARLSRTKIRIKAKFDGKGRTPEEVDWIDEAGQSLLNAATSIEDLFDRYRIELKCSQAQEVTVFVPQGSSVTVKELGESRVPYEDAATPPRAASSSVAY